LSLVLAAGGLLFLEMGYGDGLQFLEMGYGDALLFLEMGYGDGLQLLPYQSPIQLLKEFFCPRKSLFFKGF
jgi:hypothetical protein